MELEAVMMLVAPTHVFVKTKKTVANLKTYFQNQGYFRATINATTDSIEKKTGSITYHIKKGEPLFIDSIYISSSLSR